jgi:hypothetical protein
VGGVDGWVSARVSGYVYVKVCLCGGGGKRGDPTSSNRIGKGTLITTSVHLSRVSKVSRFIRVSRVSRVERLVGLEGQ